jgi:PAS domain S-box-containing protein
VLVFRDVTEQRSMERDKASQLHTARLLASIVESSDDAIIGKSLDGTIQSWNAAAERLFGYTAEHAVGRHISLVIPPERIAEEDHIIASLKAGRRIEHFETERLRSDGGRILVSLMISPIKDDAGSVVGASKIVRDITERKRAEADREKFVTLIENSTDFIGMCDLKGIPFFVNRAGLEMVGLESIEEARRMPLASFFFPEDQPRIMDEFLPSVLERGHGEIEVRFRDFKTGAARWMAYKVLTLPDVDGRPIGFATVSQDVTERKRMADNLRVWLRTCPKRTAARTSSWRYWHTSCGIRSHRSATPPVRCASAAATDTRFMRRPKCWSARSTRCPVWSTTCST